MHDAAPSRCNSSKGRMISDKALKSTALSQMERTFKRSFLSPLQLYGFEPTNCLRLASMSSQQMDPAKQGAPVTVSYENFLDQPTPLQSPKSASSGYASSSGLDELPAVVVNDWLKNTASAQQRLHLQQSAVVKMDSPVTEEDKQVEEEMRRLLYRPKKTPPHNYICHICYQRNHYIYDCPKSDAQGPKETPYQGPKKCYGEFACSKCKRTWTSGNTWANMGQNCVKCQVPVMPRKQLPIERAVSLGLLVPKEGGGYHPRRKQASGTDDSSPLTFGRF